MKNTLLLLAGLLVAGTAAQAQITPEFIMPGSSDFPMIKLSTGDMKYLTQDYSAGSVTLYNLNNSIYKQLTVPALSGYAYPNLAIVADALFDSNPSTLEYLVSYTNATNNGLRRSIIYAESGSTIMALDSVNGQDDIRYYNTASGTKMITRPSDRNSTNGRSYSRVYGLPGVYTPTRTDVGVSTIDSSPYPNPTSERTIQLPYQVQRGQKGTLEVLDMTGRIVRNYSVDSAFDHLLLDTASMATGAYVYRVTVNGTVSTGKRFVIER